MRNFLFFLLLAFVSGCSISDGAPSRPQIEPFLTVVLPSAIPQSADNRWWESTLPVVSAPVGTELVAVIGIPRDALYASIQWFGPDGRDVRDAFVFHSNTGLAPQISSEPFTLEVDTTVVYTVNGHDSRPIGDSPYSLAVSVEEGPDPDPEVTEVWVNPKSKTIKVYEYFAISWIVYCGDEACDHQNVTLSSSNPSVATVDHFGTVVARDLGRAVVTVCSVEDTSKCAGVTVTVSSETDPDPDPGITLIWVSPRSKAINIHEYFSISWELYCSSKLCTNQEVSLSSSDTSVATVDQFGTVVGQEPGLATVTVRSNQDSSVYTAVRVRVRDPNPDPNVTAVEFNWTSVTLGWGRESRHSAGLSWTVVCGQEACVDQGATISSSDPSLASVHGVSQDDPDEEIYHLADVSARSPGRAIITVRSVMNLSVYGTVEVIVRDTNITEVRVSPSSKEIEVYGNLGISWEVYCGLAPCTLNRQWVSFSSADPSIAAVDEWGTVTGWEPGHTVISVWADQAPNVMSTVSVTVVEPHPTRLEISPKSEEIDVYGYFGISWTLYCGAELLCPRPRVNFSSSDPAVASVDAYGTVVGHSSGNVIVTVWADRDSSISKTVAVTVR